MIVEVCGSLNLLSEARTKLARKVGRQWKRWLKFGKKKKKSRKHVISFE